MSRPKPKTGARNPPAPPAEGLLERAHALHRAGNVRDAAPLYMQFLATEPEHPVALHLLGQASCDLGDVATGIALMRRAVARRPDYPEAHNNLGVQLGSLGRFDEAIASYRTATRCRGKLLAPLINLSALLLARGEVAEALALARNAADRDPASTDALRAHGLALRVAGQRDAARRAFSQLVQRRPTSPDAANDLGLAEYDLGRIDAAKACYERALELAPQHGAALHNLGKLAHEAGCAAEAEALFARSVASSSDGVDARLSLARLHREQGQLAEAEAQLREVVRRRAASADGWTALGDVLRLQRRDDEAESAYRSALEASPGHPTALAELGALAFAHGDVATAVERLRAAVDRAPDSVSARSALALALGADPSTTPETLIAVVGAYESMHTRSPAPAALERAPLGSPPRRLRVGYVAADLRARGAASFVAPLLAAHDRAVVETFVYADARESGDATTRLSPLCDRWRDTSGEDDRAVAAKIRADAVDVLVDLSGFAPEHRLGVFLDRSAATQVSWLGGAGASALTVMHCRISDPCMDPEEGDVARVLRLPVVARCWSGPDAAPDAGPVPSRTAGHVTFGSFEAPSAHGVGVMAAWAKVLQAVPGSRLLLASEAYASAATRAGVASVWATHGIDAARLELVAPSDDSATVLACHRRIDVVLDPFPSNGATTVGEALWMGGPVITLTGASQGARVGTSLLRAAGLPELAAPDVDSYVARAVALAVDEERRAALRASLRDTVRASRLGDTQSFARAFEAALLRAHGRES